MNKTEAGGNKRIYSLDVLRIIATIIIVIHHYERVPGIEYKGLIDFGWTEFYYGNIVEFFFVLSGFLTHRYIKKIMEGQITFKQWVFKRASRLLPIVAIAGLFFEIFVYFYNRAVGHYWIDAIYVDPWGWLLDSLGIQCGWVIHNPKVNNPTWYISVLLLCYYIFYIITYLSRRWKIPYIYPYIFMVLLGFGIRTYKISVPFMDNVFSYRGYIAFFAGILLAEYAKKLNNKKGLFACYAIVAVSLVIFIKHYHIVSGSIRYYLTFVFFPALIVIFNSDFMIKLFNFTFIGELGQITYGVYVWHYPFIILTNLFVDSGMLKIDLNSTKVMLVCTLIYCILGALSYYFLEKPINKRISQYSGRTAQLQQQ